MSKILNTLYGSLCHHMYVYEWVNVTSIVALSKVNLLVDSFYSSCTCTCLLVTDLWLLAVDLWL